MFLPALHLPPISTDYFGGVIGRMLEFVSLRIRRSDQGQTPSLSPGLRAQTVALHRRVTMLGREFQRLARLAREGRLRVYPDRASPAARAEGTPARSRSARRPRRAPASPFGPPVSVVQGPTLPPLATRGFGWMLGFVPASYRDELAGSLRNPELAALIGASPAVARLLRSLCHGIGVTRPEGVFPPLRRRAPRAARRSQRGGRVELNGATAGVSDTAGPSGAVPPREAGILMSPQARDRWWAEQRRGGCSADDATDAPTAGRRAKS